MEDDVVRHVLGRRPEEKHPKKEDGAWVSHTEASTPP